MLFVTTEEQRYKAYSFNIAGFAMMTPLGKIVLDYVPIFRELGLGWFVFNVFLSLFLFIAGLTFVEHGRTMLEERRRYIDANKSS